MCHSILNYDRHNIPYTFEYPHNMWCCLSVSSARGRSEVRFLVLVLVWRHLRQAQDGKTTLQAVVMCLFLAVNALRFVATTWKNNSQLFEIQCLLCNLQEAGSYDHQRIVVDWLDISPISAISPDPQYVASVSCQQIVNPSDRRLAPSRANVEWCGCHQMHLSVLSSSRQNHHELSLIRKPTTSGTLWVILW